MVFRYMGRSRLMLERARNGKPSKEADAVLWQDEPRGGGAHRHFFVRPIDKHRYHLRIIVGNVTTTDRENVARREVVSAARLMGIEIADAHWSEVDKL